MTDETEKLQGFVPLKMMAFRSEERVPVVNIKSLEGSNKKDPLEAYGFGIDAKTGKLEPIFNPHWLKEDSIRISGVRVGFVNLNSIFFGGLPDIKRVTTRDKEGFIEKTGLVEKQTFVGFDAIAHFLSLRGPRMTGAECEEEIVSLINKGVKIVYIYLLSYAYGMGNRTHGKFVNKWVFSGKEFKYSLEYPINYDKFNELLLSNTEWKIYTGKTDTLLRRLILAGYQQKEED